MYILSLKTNEPEAEVGIYKDVEELDKKSWPAHRELSQTIHQKIKELLEHQKLELKDLNAVVIYKGPGSFTGLRIGFSVANALAYSLNLHIVSESGNDWIDLGIKRLLDGGNEKVSLPEYGAKPHITKPVK